MKAMLLAAGEGRRLRPLTEKIPKPMIVLAGKPILEHNIRLLAYYNIRDIMVNLHHCPRAVTDYFGDGRRWNVVLHYSYETHPLGTAGAVKNVESFFGETFLVMYGDNLTNCDLSTLRAKHDSAKAAATLALFYREDTASSGVAFLSEGDRISAFQEKPQTGAAASHWVNAGLMILQPEVLNIIPRDRPADFGFDVIPALIQSGAPVVGYRMTEDLWWVDTRGDYERLRGPADRGELRLR